MRLRLICLFVLGILATAVATEHPQAGVVDYRFDAGTPIIVGGYQARIHVLPDDSFLVWGPGDKRILKFMKNGRADKQFALRVPATVEIAATTATGQILAVLNISPTEWRLVRLNADGTKDTSFFDQRLRFSQTAITVGPDGRILLASWESGGLLRRYEASGELDRSFSVRTTTPVDMIRIQSNGEIIIAGPFLAIQGSGRNGLARLHTDGTLDPSYKPGLTIYSTSGLRFFDGALDAADNLYLAGSFTVVEDVVRRAVARLTPSGTLDRAFSPVIDWFRPWYKGGICLDSSNNVFLLGEFSSFRITNGIVDQDFEADWVFDTMQQASDQTFYAFAHNLGQTNVVSKICRLFSNGAWDQSFNPPGPNGRINKVRVLPSGNLLIAGQFGPQPNSYTFPRSGLAMLYSDGSLNTNFNVPFHRVLDMDVDTNGHVFVIARDSPWDSKPYVARANIEGPPELITFRPKESPYHSARSLLVLRNGKVLVSGITESARFNSDLTPDPAWETYLSGDQMVEAPDGSVYALDDYSGVRHINLQGQDNPAFKSPSFGRRRPFPDPGTDGWERAQLTSLALTSDGKLYVTGDFARVGTNFTRSVVRLNQDGYLERTYPELLEPGTEVLARPQGGALLALGSRLIGLDSPWTSQTNNGAIYSLEFAQDGGVYVGGEFSSVGDVPSPNLVRLWGNNFAHIALLPGLENDSMELTLRAPAGSTLLLEKSADLLSWNLVQRLPNFAGDLSLAIDREPIKKLFFRARLE